jgi:hypothetical protein
MTVTSDAVAVAGKDPLRHDRESPSFEQIPAAGFKQGR